MMSRNTLEKEIIQKFLGERHDSLVGVGVRHLPIKGNYALCIDKIKTSSEDPQPYVTAKSGNTIYRPLTFKEDIAARVHDFESKIELSEDERAELFKKSTETCSAIAYKPGTPRIKVIRLSDDLLSLGSTFNESYVKKDFDSLDGLGFFLDKSYPGGLRGSKTKSQFLFDPLFNALLEEDKALISAYCDIAQYVASPQRQDSPFDISLDYGPHEGLKPVKASSSGFSANWPMYSTHGFLQLVSKEKLE